jgi:hypothetical protein
MTKTTSKYSIRQLFNKADEFIQLEENNCDLVQDVLIAFIRYVEDKEQGV